MMKSPVFTRWLRRLSAFLMLVSLLLSCLSVSAESAESEDPYALPLDISVGGYPPDPACITEDGYQDASVTVRKEMQRFNDTDFYVVWVEIKSPTQLRTAVAGKPNERATALPSRMAKARNAVFACNGEFYVQRTRDVFIWRQGVMFRNEPDPDKDVLIIDDKGDFHIFTSPEKQQDIDAYLQSGGTIVNAFSFGPGLVVDGVKRDVSEYFHLFDGAARLARTAMGQMGPLSYVFARCVGKTLASPGCNHQQMADFMESLGVQQAYNLDGGQSCVMLLNGKYCDGTLHDSERAQSDIIYIASAVNPETK